MTMQQAYRSALRRAAETGVRHRVAVCTCFGGRHFVVNPVDQMPSAVMA